MRIQVVWVKGNVVISNVRHLFHIDVTMPPKRNYPRLFFVCDADDIIKLCNHYSYNNNPFLSDRNLFVVDRNPFVVDRNPFLVDRDPFVVDRDPFLSNSGWCITLPRWCITLPCRCFIHHYCCAGIFNFFIFLSPVTFKYLRKCYLKPSVQIEAIKIHHLRPRRYKIRYELLSRIRTSVHFSKGTQF